MSVAERERVLVGTHDGEFHADEILGIAALKLVYSDRGIDGKRYEVEVLRSRDPHELADCDFLIDVGKEYSPEQKKFDHHQKGGAGIRDNGVPLASFGLLWREFGPRACYGSDVVAEYIDSHFVQLIDGYDNGIELFQVTASRDGVSSIVPGRPISNCNHLPGNGDREKFDRALGGAEFLLEGEIGHALVACEASPAIQEALTSSSRPDIIILPEIEGTIWREVLPEFSSEALCVVQPEGDKWVVRTTPEEPGGTGRKIFPAEWSGIEGKENIREVTGIDNVVFIHDGRFFAKTEDKESALELANDVVAHYRDKLAA